MRSYFGRDFIDFVLVIVVHEGLVIGQDGLVVGRRGGVNQTRPLVGLGGDIR